jgi:uncharacterized repeat protein (TIGR03847 family)
MTSYVFDLKPCSRLTLGAVGPPGERTFYIQGIQGRTVVSLVMEKQQAQALANGIDELLTEVDEKFPPDRKLEAVRSDLTLVDPITPRFRVGRLGLGYDSDEDLLVIFVQEMAPEEEEEGAPEPATGRFWATREQMAALSEQTKRVAAAGRPICALCGNPIDPDGHFCPPSNGHAATRILQ